MPNLWCLSIRSHGSQELVRTALSLPGPRVEVSHWGRAAALAATLPEAVVPGVPPAVDSGAAPGWDDLRLAVAGILQTLVTRLEDAFPRALAAAPQAWDRVDHLLLIFDAPLMTQINGVRRKLELAAAPTPEPPAPSTTRAVAIEGLLVIEAACGLARLGEQRLSSLIRLRVRSGADDLLPGGRPFLDLAAALKEAARAWV